MCGTDVNPLRDNIDKRLNQLYTDNQQWRMDISNYQSFEPKVYYDLIEYFDSVVLVYKANDTNIKSFKHKDFNYFMESIVNSCITEGKTFVPIYFNHPKNQSHLLKDIECLYWFGNTSEDQQATFNERLEETLKGHLNE